MILQSRCFWDSVWAGFLGNALADLLVGILLVAFLARISKLFARADLRVGMTSRPTTPGHRALKFTIQNEGRLNLGPREAHINIFLDPELTILLQTLTAPPNVNASFGRPDMIMSVDPGPRLSIQCFIDGHVFPKTHQELAEVEVIVTPGWHYEIRYFVSSVHGMFPHRPWRDKIRIWWKHLRKQPVADGTYLGTWNLDPIAVPGLEGLGVTPPGE